MKLEGEGALKQKGREEDVEDEVRIDLRPWADPMEGTQGRTSEEW